MQIRVHNIQVNTKMMVSYHKNMDIEGQNKKNEKKLEETGYM